MINPGSMEKRSVSITILSEDQIWEIKRAALDVMFTVGFKVLHAGARKMLKQAGAIVKDEMVRVPEFVVEQCLLTAPKGFTVFDRHGKRSMEVEGRKSYFGTSTASPNTKDALTGEIHPTRVRIFGLGRGGARRA
jgi:trimethylamine--corrinoid protein Co-methyltransferase